MDYVVRVLPIAKRQAKYITAWWHDNRPEASTMFEDELAVTLHSLSSMPDRGLAVQHPRGNRRALVLHKTRVLLTYEIRRRARRIDVVLIERPR